MLCAWRRPRSGCAGAACGRWYGVISVTDGTNGTDETEPAASLSSIASLDEELEPAVARRAGKCCRTVTFPGPRHPSSAGLALTGADREPRSHPGHPARRARCAPTPSRVAADLLRRRHGRARRALGRHLRQLGGQDGQPLPRRPRPRRGSPRGDRAARALAGRGLVAGLLGERLRGGARAAAGGALPACDVAVVALDGVDGVPTLTSSDTTAIGDVVGLGLGPMGLPVPAGPCPPARDGRLRPRGARARRPVRAARWTLLRYRRRSRALPGSALRASSRGSPLAAAQRWALSAGDRALLAAPYDDERTLLAGLLVPLAVGSAAVLCRHLDLLDDAALARRIARGGCDGGHRSDAPRFHGLPASSFRVTRSSAGNFLATLYVVIGERCASCGPACQRRPAPPTVPPDEGFLPPCEPLVPHTAAAAHRMRATPPLARRCVASSRHWS